MQIIVIDKSFFVMFDRRFKLIVLNPTFFCVTNKVDIIRETVKRAEFGSL